MPMVSCDHCHENFWMSSKIKISKLQQGAEFQGPIFSVQLSLMVSRISMPVVWIKDSAIVLMVGFYGRMLCKPEIPKLIFSLASPYKLWIPCSIWNFLRKGDLIAKKVLVPHPLISWSYASTVLQPITWTTPENLSAWFVFPHRATQTEGPTWNYFEIWLSFFDNFTLILFQAHLWNLLAQTNLTKISQI